MKSFLWTAFLVGVGVYLWIKLTGRKVVGGTVTFGEMSIKPAEGSVFYGPDIDPKTGAYLNTGARSGTVEFNAQGN